MASFRRYYHRTVRRHGRFYFAVLLTIVVVAYLLVPWVTRLVDAARGYSPNYYEPKDFTRQEYILRHGLPPSGVTFRDLVVNSALVLLVVIVWLTVLPRGGMRR
jgi:hypothetical protein